MAQTPLTMKCTLAPAHTSGQWLNTSSNLAVSFYNQGAEIEVIGEGLTYTGTGSREDCTYNFYIQWNTLGSVQAPATDPIIEGPTEKLSDKWGKASVYATGDDWRTGEDNLYYAKVEYIVAAATPVTVSATSADFCINSPLEAMVEDVEGLLGDLQRQPIMNVISTDCIAGTTYRFALGGLAYGQAGPWLTTPTPVFRRYAAADEARTTIIPTLIDYDNWAIQVPTTYTAGDEVELEYALFKYWPDSEIARFLGLALSAINSFKGTTEWTLVDVPDYVSAALIVGARMFALEDLILSLMFQNKRLIFADDTVRAIIQAELASTSTYFWTYLLPASKKRGQSTPNLITSHETIAPVTISGNTWARNTFLRGVRYY